MYTPNISEILGNVTSTTSVDNSAYNYLRPNAFRFSIKDIPNVAFTCQSANLPAVQIGYALQPTPFVDQPRIGDKLNYGDFAIRFLISEDMTNYQEIHDWIVALGFPSDYNQFTQFAGNRVSRFPFIRSSDGSVEVAAYSDGTLTILDSNNVPKTNIKFRDLFPTSIEALDFDVTSSSVEYFVGIASFRYRTFEIEAL